jgi:hypothetical protein
MGLFHISPVKRFLDSASSEDVYKSSDAVAAGKLVRNVRREVWQKQMRDADALCELSNWNWKRKRLVRKFDQMLVDHCGAENLNTILKQMDTRLESWLAACEQ